MGGQGGRDGRDEWRERGSDRRMDGGDEELKWRWREGQGPVRTGGERGKTKNREMREDVNTLN
jgi:hypothetical protein